MIEQDDCDQKGGKKRRRGPKADQLSSSDPEILKAKNICEMAVTESVDDLLFAVSSNEAVCCRLKKAAMKKILVNAKANDGSSAAPPKETVNGISKWSPQYPWMHLDHLTVSLCFKPSCQCQAF